MSSRDTQPTRRPTIGLLLLGLHIEYEIEVMEGAAAAARDLDVNLLSLVGGGLPAPQSVMYDLTSAEKFDGLLAGVSLFLGDVNPAALQSFQKRFSHLPVIGFGLNTPGIPSVVSDGYTGMHQAVTHLIQHHGYRQIAFIRGVEHFEGNERYRAYTDVLAENDIELDMDLVASGDFTPPSGRATMRQLLDLGKPIQAVVAANDDMAMGAIAVLREQGLRIPEDIAVVGYDDSQQSRYLDVPLTTVRQPIREVGYRALELLVNSLHGEPLPDSLFVPTEFIVRRSCGCIPESIAQAAVEETFSSLVTASETLTDTSDAVPSQVWDALLADVSGEDTGKFLDILDVALRQAHNTGENLSMWGAHLSVMRRRILAYVADHMDDATGESSILHAENLLHQAQVLVSEAIHRIDGARVMLAEQQQWQFQQFDVAMAAVLDLQELGSGVVDYFPDLGIERCYLSLFDENSNDRARLLLSYEDGNINLTPDAPLRKSSHLIVLDDVLASDERHTLIVEPLFLRNRPLGFVHFEYGVQAGHLYDRIAGLFSGAIFRALTERRQVLAQQEIERRASLLVGAAEISRAASSITDLDELLSRAVTSIQERFDLYYAGIFLSDENRRWAVLVAGTGEAGRIMLERGHKLEIAETSMIGSCVVTGQARVTFDVEQAEVHRKNPVLPDTRSEMALPLLSRDQVIGAMTIQSTEPGAFSQEDITALQTMADQLANAIENARLIDQMAQSRRELEIASGQYTQESWRRYAKGTADLLGYRYRLVDIEPAPELHTEARATLEQQESVLTNLVPGENVQGLQARSALGVPIRLRNQVLGVVNLRFEEDVVPAETVDLVEQIADRLAISLESARLLEETRSTADREQLTGQVTGRMRESLEVDAVVKTAAEQIREVMDLSSVTIRLAPQESSEG